jgi:hypothetical protein
VKWATETFGETDPFTTMLAGEQDWIEELIRKRNAVEHPRGHSGTLYIRNFERITENKFVAPTWHRDAMSRTDLFADIEVIMGNLLTLAEDILINCIVKRTKYNIIQFVEIPEDQRNSNCPIRITASLKEGVLPGRN